MKTIEIIVSPTGQSRMETKGFTGTACRQASALLEQALGKPQSEQLTIAYFQTPTLAETNTHERA